MKKAITPKKSAIASKEANGQMNDAAKVQHFFDICKKMERIDEQAPHKSSIRMRKRALLNVSELYRGEKYETLRIEHQYCGYIYDAGFDAENGYMSCIYLRDCTHVVRCFDMGAIAATMMEDIERIHIPIDTIKSITYIA